jgi:hypothetical protein
MYANAGNIQLSVHDNAQLQADAINKITADIINSLAKIGLASPTRKRDRTPKAAQGLHRELTFL